jgi:hypothetical protein
MDKPGYVSLDKSGVNKRGASRDSMPDLDGFCAYANPNEESYQQDSPPPGNLQNNPDVNHSINVLPERYY